VPSHPPFDGHRVEQVLENTGLLGFGASSQNRTEGSQDLSSVQRGLKNVEGCVKDLSVSCSQAVSELAEQQWHRPRRAPPYRSCAITHSHKTYPARGLVPG
jgi:hypothetical protein